MTPVSTARWLRGPRHRHRWSRRWDRRRWRGRAASAGAERGSASVWLVGLCAVLVLAVTASVLAGSAIVTRHRATAAADLSALAAAGSAIEGRDAACAAAADIATGMGAEVVSCELAGVVAMVRVSVSAELGVVGHVRAEASARAGPVSEWSFRSRDPPR